MKKVSIVGGGFSGMAAAAFLAQGGAEVTLLEKNATLGGRARQFEADGFHFDMGPSWYWMPDVFERFYNNFDHTTSDFYQLDRLDPSYQILFDDGDIIKVPTSIDELHKLFESREKGSSRGLEKFLAAAKYKYEVGMREFVHKPSHSIWEYMDVRILKSAIGLNMFGSISKEVRTLFKDPKLIQLLEFPVLFLGAAPDNTPALYSLMNYADLKLGTWYPQGGMVQVPRAMEQILGELNVDVKLEFDVKKVSIDNESITHLSNLTQNVESDFTVCSGDYHHFDQNILPNEYKQYSEKYWDRRKMAPSSLLFYLGLDKTVEGLLHHNLFFDADFTYHASQIYDNPNWPDNPLFYVCCPSKTDNTVAPVGKENVFILIPVASGLNDNENIQNILFDLICDRILRRISVDIRPHIIYKRTFSVSDFVSEYHSFKGNAYGLANTLLQTAFLKPKMKSKKLDNLYYAGQLTTPGPGVPPSLISGEVAAKEVLKRIK